MQLTLFSNSKWKQISKSPYHAGVNFTNEDMQISFFGYEKLMAI